METGKTNLETGKANMETGKTSMKKGKTNIENDKTNMGKAFVKTPAIWRWMCSVLTVVGVALSLSSLLTAHWYEVRYVTGIVVTRVSMGLWVDYVCVGLEPCAYRWMMDNTYQRHTDVEMPGYCTLVTIQGVAITLGLTATLALYAVVSYPHARLSLRSWGHFCHYFPLLLSGILSMTSPILLFTHGEPDKLNWGSLLPLVGGAVMVFTGFLAMATMRPTVVYLSDYEYPQAENKQKIIKTLLI